MTVFEWVSLVFMAANAVGVPIGLTIWRNVKADIAKAELEARTAQRDLAEYKERVASEFARNGYVSDVEARLMAAVNNLDRKLDQLLARGHGD